MAILYGTQSNGETLPVQVNAFGQLVAQGLDGAKGDTGPEGPPGPKGDKGDTGAPGVTPSLQISEWTPEIAFQSDGAALIQYDYQKGQIWDFGDLSFFAFEIKISDIGITNARGRPVIKGFPTLWTDNGTSPFMRSVYFPRRNFFKGEYPVSGVLSYNGERFEFLYQLDGEETKVPTTEIRDDADYPTFLAGTFIGRRATQAEIALQNQIAEQMGDNS